MQANEELSAVLRGGLHGRFQSAFHLLENALEVLDDNIAHSVTPAKYDDLHPLLQQVGEQLLLLRRLGEHAADAAIAPVLQDVCVPQPMDLLEQLREIGALNADEIRALEDRGRIPGGSTYYASWNYGPLADFARLSVIRALGKEPDDGGTA